MPGSRRTCRAMATAASTRAKKQRIEMAKRIYMRHKKDNKVHGLRAAYSFRPEDLAGRMCRSQRPGMQLMVRMVRAKGVFHLTVCDVKFVLGFI